MVTSGHLAGCFMLQTPHLVAPNPKSSSLAMSLTGIYPRGLVCPGHELAF